MNKLFTLSSLVLSLVLAGSVSAKQILVSPSRPHGIISTAQPAGTRGYRVRVVTINGQLMPLHAQRSAYWVAPGRYTIGFQAIMNNFTGSDFSPAGVGGPQNRKTITVNVRPGWEYFFAAKIVHDRAYLWRPMILEKKRIPGYHSHS